MHFLYLVDGFKSLYQDSIYGFISFMVPIALIASLPQKEFLCMNL